MPDKPSQETTTVRQSNPVIPKSWSGEDDGERWELVVEHDLMEAGSPYVVTVELLTDVDDKHTHHLACLTPDEAREVASALHVYAFFADKANR